MSAGRWRLIFVIAVLVYALVFLIVLKPGREPLPGFARLFSNIKLGLDIKGGARIEYKVEVEQGTEKPVDVVDDVWTVLRSRLDAAGYTEAVVKKAFKESGAYIIVEIPEATDTAQAEKLIGSTGILYFGQVLDEAEYDPNTDSKLVAEAKREKAQWLKGRDGKWYLVRKEIMRRKDLVLVAPRIVRAAPVVDQREMGYKVVFELAKENVETFAKITRALVVPENAMGNPAVKDKRLAIVLDNVVQFAGYVVSTINDGRAEIKGKFTLDEAKRLAAILRSGALPARLVKVSAGWVAPLLGKDIINASLKAGIWGIIIVMVYMIIVYGVMGIVADLALLYNTFLLLGVLASTGAILTLPGIAGIILTIGTTVDGNVIIYERIKEELRAGKTSKAAISAGFSRSTVTLMDANLTTIIAGLVLYYFGTGTIRGFAVTLIIGVLGSLFVNLVFSRLMLDAFAPAIKLRKAKGGAEA